MTTDSTQRVAARVLQAAAYDRTMFTNVVQELLGHAILDFYRARLATKNKRTKWVRHWQSEVHVLLERRLVVALLHPIRGFKDRRKAFDVALAEIRGSDASYRRAAEQSMVENYGLREIKVHLDDSDTDAFWQAVERATAPVLARPQ